MLTIRPIAADDLTDVARFRYEVYVEEMHRKQVYADPITRRIQEPLDDFGRILIAVENGRIAGTLRTNVGGEGDLGPYVELYNMRRVGSLFPEHTSITTKLMVRPEHRGTTVGLRLACACFELGLESDIHFDFIDCNPHLEGFFQRLGYCRYQERICHPEYGEVLPLMLSLPTLSFTVCASERKRHLPLLHS